MLSRQCCCGVERELEVGDPVVARCKCGRLWCWLCGDDVTVASCSTDLSAATSRELGGLTPAALRTLARAGNPALDPALRAVHSMAPHPWRRGLAQLAATAAGQPAKRASACPAYLEFVEHSGVYPEIFDADAVGGEANRGAWQKVVSGAAPLRR
jgi:hypothetical protein